MKIVEEIWTTPYISNIHISTCTQIHSCKYYQADKQVLTNRYYPGTQMHRCRHRYWYIWDINIWKLLENLIAVVKLFHNSFLLWRQPEAGLTIALKDFKRPLQKKKKKNFFFGVSKHLYLTVNFLLIKTKSGLNNTRPHICAHKKVSSLKEEKTAFL